ncbi:hypothetical protein GCM10009119_42270 [Algoriphagus jejuensis]|uniref:DUF4231 domain-containing protein n=1 Tax=Algoriphagus jejuensis TaxID=419934 RepID=A0ABN1N5L1_9BACT
MANKLSSELLKLSVTRSKEEKVDVANALLEQLIDHFQTKADRSKRLYQWYKYGSIVLAALTTIISSLQAIYPTSFPQWILPIVSAGATVTVALLGASGAQKIWINSRTTQQHLQTESFSFNQQTGIYSVPKEEAINRFSEQLVRLWNDGHSRWEQHVGDD